MTENIIEDLAELEHEQWMTWSKTLSTFEELSDVRMKRWRLLWKPYSKLTEEQKEQDRIWARRTFIVMAQIYGNPYDEGFKAGQESFNACKKHIEKAGTMTIRHRVIYCEECRKELIDDARKEFIENNADIQEGQLKIYIDNAKEAERQKVLDEVEKIIDEWLEEQKTCEGNIYKNWRQYSPADMLNLKNKLKSFMKR